MTTQNTQQQYLWYSLLAVAIVVCLVIPVILLVDLVYYKDSYQTQSETSNAPIPKVPIPKTATDETEKTAIQKKPKITNTPPRAQATYTRNPEESKHPRKFLQYAFDASQSEDSEDSLDNLQVRWDFNNDGVWDTQYTKANTIVTHNFSKFGDYQVVLMVKDSHKAQDTTKFEIDNYIAEVSRSKHKDVAKDQCMECHYPGSSEEPPHEIDSSALCVDCHKMQN